MSHRSPFRCAAPAHPLLGALAGVLAGALAGGVPAACADVYKFVDEHGVVHLSDRQLNPDYRLIVSSPRAPASTRDDRTSVNRLRFTPLIAKISRAMHMDPLLIHAVIQAESSYDPNAISHKGAVGLMQLMPGTAQRYGVRDRKNPAQNIYAGVRYLRDLILQFRNLALALAAYNAGENAVAAHGNRIPPYPETRTYVRRVLAHYVRARKSS